METARKTSNQVLGFTIATTTTVATWRIKVSQIECWATYKAPTDCFQYYTGVSGYVESLNYPNVALEITYTVCLRREAGMCATNWMAAQTTTDSFILDGTITDGSCWGIYAPSGSYVSIPGSQGSAYGGAQLAADCTSTDASLDDEGSVITAVGLTNTLIVATPSGASAITGFNLAYNQLPCGSVNMLTSTTV